MKWMMILFLAWFVFAGCEDYTGPCTSCGESVDEWDGGGDGSDHGGDKDGGAVSDRGGDKGGGDGGAKICGGLPGLLCDKGTWCDYSRNDCGGADDTGVCSPIPGGCPQVVAPVCACDNKVYSNECYAHQAGLDLNDSGSCTPPAGQFSCGARFCPLAPDYCQRTVSDVYTLPDDWVCLPFPATCGSAPSCACLSGEPCGNACAPAGGGLRLTCPGG